jgi:hypothetical protein
VQHGGARFRTRFPIAHDCGHYLLHRHRQQRFACGDADIEARKVDIVVVYKIDRLLTRSLTDFYRMTEVFERHGVFFVSVTPAEDVEEASAWTRF